MASDPQLKRSFRGHHEAITAVAFNPNMKQIASSSEDYVVTVWSFVPQQRPYKFIGHKGPVNDIAFSPNGQVLASASKDETVRLWKNYAEGHCTTLRAHNGAVRSVDFSSDGKLLLTASDDKTLKVWSAYDKKLMFSLSGHLHSARAAQFSPDIRRIVSGSNDKTVKLWDVSHRQELYSFDDHLGPVTSVKFHPDGGCVASCSQDKKIKIWDLRSRKFLQHYDAHAGSVNDISFHPSGNYLISASDDSKLKIWDLRQGKLVYTLFGHAGDCTAVNFSPCGDYFGSGGSDRVVMVWKSNLEDVSFEHIEDITDTRSIQSTYRSHVSKSGKKLSNLMSTIMESPSAKKSLLSPKRSLNSSYRAPGTVERSESVSILKNKVHSEQKRINDVAVRKHKYIGQVSDFDHHHYEGFKGVKTDTRKLSDVISKSLGQIGDQLESITKSMKVLENKLEANENQIVHLMNKTGSPIRPAHDENKDIRMSYNYQIGNVGNDSLYSGLDARSSIKKSVRYESDIGGGLEYKSPY